MLKFPNSFFLSFFFKSWGDFFAKFLQGNLSNYIANCFTNIITGFRPKATMGWGSLGTVWEGGGTKTRKGMPFWIFLKHVLRGKFRIKVKQKHLKAYSLCSLLRGTILHTVDDVVSTNSKQKWSPLMREIKTRLVRLKTLECACVLSRDYPGLSRYFAPFRAIYLKMGNGSLLCILIAFTAISLYLPFFSFSIGCPVHSQVGAFRHDSRSIEGEGGGARGGGTGGQRYR